MGSGRKGVSRETSERMAGIGRRDTAGELALRRELFARGYRYRVQLPVPGRPRRTIDIAFTRAKVAVFVDGCYWHGCPRHGTQSKTNPEWWSEKIATNRARDADTTAHLESLGWRVVRIWEHESAEEGADRVLQVLRVLRGEPDLGSVLPGLLAGGERRRGVVPDP